MLSEAPAAGLKRYAIVPKIRALRLKENLSLMRFGEHTARSSGFFVEDGDWPAVPAAPDTSEDRLGVRGWPGMLLC
jgi:hypothetical protein